MEIRDYFGRSLINTSGLQNYCLRDNLSFVFSTSNKKFRVHIKLQLAWHISIIFKLDILEDTFWPSENTYDLVHLISAGKNNFTQMSEAYPFSVKRWLSYTSTVDYNTMNKFLFKKPTRKKTPAKPHHKTNLTKLKKKINATNIQSGVNLNW